MLPSDVSNRATGHSFDLSCCAGVERDLDWNYLTQNGHLMCV